MKYYVMTLTLVSYLSVQATENQEKPKSDKEAEMHQYTWELARNILLEYGPNPTQSEQEEMLKRISFIYDYTQRNKHLFGL